MFSIDADGRSSQILFLTDVRPLPVAVLAGGRLVATLGQLLVDWIGMNSLLAPRPDEVLDFQLAVLCGILQTKRSTRPAAPPEPQSAESWALGSGTDEVLEAVSDHTPSLAEVEEVRSELAKVAELQECSA